MTGKKLTEKVDVPGPDEVLATLKKIEKHLRALVYYSTPERAFIASAGKASPNAPDPSIEEVIAEEIGKYFKENK